MTLASTIKGAARAFVQDSPVPMRVVQEVRMEVHLGLVRVRRRVHPRVRAQERVLSEMTGVTLHYGCGSRILAGWLNIDGWASPGIDFVTDLRQPLPLADRSCRLIFSEHVFEHIDRPFRVGVLLTSRSPPSREWVRTA